MRENVVEPENVTLKKLPEMFLRFRQPVDFEKFADEANVGAPGEFHFFRAVIQVEFRRKSFLESLCARVPRVDKRAVDVEENEPNHALRKLNVGGCEGNAVHGTHSAFLIETVF
jgi:hypothetical protein